MTEAEITEAEQAIAACPVGPWIGSNGGSCDSLEVITFAVVARTALPRALKELREAEQKAKDMEEYGNDMERRWDADEDKIAKMSTWLVDAKAELARKDALLANYERVRRNASESVGLLETAGMGKVEGRGNCLIDMVREICELLARKDAEIAELKEAVASRNRALKTSFEEASSLKKRGDDFHAMYNEPREAREAENQALCAEVERLRKALSAYRETREIERRYSLDDRAEAVMSLTGAIRHISESDHGMLARINAVELLKDGIKNAIDGRSTGREFRTIRARYRNERDGPFPPSVSESDRRCQRCGAVNPPGFSRCEGHRPEPIVDATLSPAAQPKKEEYCTRVYGHTGPCNGVQRSDCEILAAQPTPEAPKP